MTARISSGQRGKTRAAAARRRQEQPAAALSAADFAARLATAARGTERLLGRLLSASPSKGEIARPRRLIEAMRYAALSGGKRLRPFLAIESAALFDVPRRRALLAGAAIECIHCYSLAHDDLPAMDDDELRRGRPTLHRAFDEATAILAGDGLLTLAFDVLARPETHPEPKVRIAFIRALARAAGLGGMVGGQMVDLSAEGRYGPAKLSETQIAMLDSMKTGALIRLACLTGPILAQARPSAHAALARYGHTLGQAFQIADDLLDIESNVAALGKLTGKDAAQGKATLVTTLGKTGARARLTELIAQAQLALNPFGAAANALRAAARFVAERDV